MRRLAAFLTLSALSWLVSLIPVRQRRGGVLILRLDALGDFVLWTHSGLRETSAYARTLGRPVTLLARQEWTGLAERMQIADTVLALDTNRFCRELGYRIRWLWKLRRQGYEYVIQPRAARDIWLEDWIVLAVRARCSIGAEGLAANIPAPYKSICDRWYTQRLPTIPLWHHETERNLAFARDLTGCEISLELPTLPLGTTSISLPYPYFVIAPGAAHASRQWPAGRFASLAKTILETSSLHCILIGTQRDVASCGTVAAALPGDRVVNLVNRTTIDDLTSIIAGARFLVGNESGPCHVAAALGIGAVAVVGGGHFGWFLPYPERVAVVAPASVFETLPCFRCNWNCCFDIPDGDPYPCIERVSVDSVVSAVRQMKLLDSNDAAADVTCRVSKQCSAGFTVSCIIPTHNRCIQLRSAIDSVIAQTQPPDEIIVVDDGSSDGTIETLAQLQREQPELTLIVLRQANLGPAAARNAGMRRASGEYVVFLDDDDLWLPNKLARQGEFLAADPDLVLLGCATDTLALSGGTRLVPIEAWQMLLRNWFLTPGVIARRDALLACGGFPEDMRCCEDYALWLVLVQRYKCAMLNEVLVICGHGKPSFGASGLSRDLAALYAGEREALRRWRKQRRSGSILLVSTEALAAVRHLRRRLLVAWRAS